MEQLYFTKNQVKIVKGIAILLMLAHHLFAFPERIFVEEGYISILAIKGQPIEFFIGEFGNLCIAIYLFLSGYGMYILRNRSGNVSIKGLISRISKLYINYWIVFLVFIPIGFIFFDKTFEIGEFILNFLGLKSSYNGEWWFFRLYIELIILFPLLRLIVREKLFLSILNTFAIMVLGSLAKIIFSTIPNTESIRSFIVYKDIIMLLRWQSCFLIGYICAKFNIFSTLKKYMKKWKIDNKVAYILIIIMLVLIRKIKFMNLFDFILATIFIFAINNLFYNSIFNKILTVLGNHSTNMWLIHSFFCYTYFQKLVFKPRLSILILLWLVILSLVSSIIINYLIDIYNQIKIKINNRQTKTRILTEV